LVACAGGTLLLCYAGVVVTLVGTWSANPEYSYGFLLPVISGYLIAARWHELRCVRATADYGFGIPVSLIGLAMLVIGRVSALVSLQEASLIVTLAGFILVLFGRAVLSRLWFPVTYLLLSIPMWDAVITRLQAPSQLLSGSIAIGLLRTIGIPAIHEGTRIVLPNLTLDVMRECSGVNQLLTIIAIALPTAYLFFKDQVRRATLIAFSVVVAYLSNGARIALVGFLGYRHLGNGDLRSMHLIEGLAVSAFGYVLIFGAVSLLSRGRRGVRPPADCGTSSAPLAESNRRAWPQFAVLATALVVGAFQMSFRPAEVRLERDLRTFPSHIAGWTRDLNPEPVPTLFPAIDDDFLNGSAIGAGERRFRSDDELIRSYRNTSGRRLQLYIGYHRSQTEGRELAGDASRALSVVAAPVSVASGSETIELNQVVAEHRDSRHGLVYWYDVNGRVVNTMYRAKAYMVWDALTRRRTNGAVVIVGWRSRDRTDSDVSRHEALSFASAILPLLTQFIPS
jgi:EpsI family protein